jgi:hypothetical protein
MADLSLFALRNDEDGVRWTIARSGPETVSRPKLLILLCTALRYSLINRRDAETASTEPTSKNSTKMRLISGAVAYGSIFDLGRFEPAG